MDDGLEEDSNAANAGEDVISTAEKNEAGGVEAPVPVEPADEATDQTEEENERAEAPHSRHAKISDTIRPPCVPDARNPRKKRTPLRR